MKGLPARGRHFCGFAPCTVAAPPDTNVGAKGSVEGGSAALRAARREVLARGLSRFETGAVAPRQPDWEQLSERVVCILGQNPSSYTLNGTNCYLVGNGPRRLLVDTGEKFYGSEAFVENLGKCMKEYEVEGLSGILITHMHYDHYGNIEKLQRLYGPLPVYSYDQQREDTGLLLKEIRRRGLEHHFLGEDGMPQFTPEVGKPLTSSPLPDALDLSWADSFVRQFPGDSVEAKVRFLFFFQWHGADLMSKLRCGEIDWRPVRDGDVIEVQGATLSALFSPGHASDHVSFLLDEEHSLFSGDHVLGWGTTLVFDMRDYMETLQRMLALKPVRLYPGHGGFIEDGVDMLTRYVEHRQRREEQAWQALQRREQPVPVKEIARELYPHVPEDKLWMAADNVEKLFRKFAGDRSAVAFLKAHENNGQLELRPFTVPESYSVRKLPDTLVWAARRSITASSLSSVRRQKAKL